MKNFSRVLAVSLGICLSAATLFAKPNFTGDWKMNASKSDFGPVPAPQKIERSIKHDDPQITIKSHQAGAQGEIKAELSYTTDGKEFTNKTATGEVKGTAKWEGDVLLVVSTRHIQDVVITQSDRWTLAADGKFMQIASTISTPQGEFKLTVSFDKQ